MHYGSALALCGLLCAGLPARALRRTTRPMWSRTAGSTSTRITAIGATANHVTAATGRTGPAVRTGPDLTQSLKSMTYEQFAEVVVNGRKNVTTSQTNVMPAFGTVEDVALYLDDIYGYLKARSDDKLPRGRPKRIGEED